MEISWNFVSPKKWEPCIVQREYVRGFPLSSEKLLLTSLAFVLGISLQIDNF